MVKRHSLQTALSLVGESAIFGCISRSVFGRVCCKCCSRFFQQVLGRLRRRVQIERYKQTTHPVTCGQKNRLLYSKFFSFQPVAAPGYRTSQVKILGWFSVVVQSNPPPPICHVRPSVGGYSDIPCVGPNWLKFGPNDMIKQLIYRWAWFATLSPICLASWQCSHTSHAPYMWVSWGSWCLGCSWISTTGQITVLHFWREKTEVWAPL